MKKKILFILHLPPPVHGAAMVGSYLKESIAINTSFDTHYINLTTAPDLERIGKFGLSTFLSVLKIQSDIAKAVFLGKYDLFYVTINAKGPGYYKDLFVILLLKLFGKKLIYHFHNKGIATVQHKKLNDLLYRFTFRKSKTILLSQRLYPDISRYVNEKDVYYCPNGIPEIQALFDGKPASKKNVNTCRLLFLSNMVVEKGVYDLLAACKILKQKKLQFECHFAGAWSEINRNEFERRVQSEGLSDRITLHGKMFGAEKAAIFQTSDVFVFPTFYHNECFPLVNLEAMQYSLPVVTTTIGGIPDMVSDGEPGFLVSPNDPVSLAGKLELLISNPALRMKMGIAGRKHYENSFTIEKFEVNMANILHQALAS